MTLSCVAPVVFRLEHSLKLFKENKRIYCLNLAYALQSSIKNKLHPFLERTDVIVAAVMEARFKLAWLSCQEKKKKYISKIVDLIISESVDYEEHGSREGVFIGRNFRKQQSRQE